MSDQAPPPTEPAAESLNNSDAPTTNLDGAAVQEAVATDAGIPLDGETAPIATNLEVPAVPIDSEIKDTQMADAPSDQQPPSSAPIASAATPDSASRAPSPAPIPTRVSTPMRNSNPNGGGEGERTSSRAASVHPDSGFTMPTEAPVHGAPVRQYINTKITAVLLEGMKKVAREQPKDPLRVLGQFLLDRSKELEGTAAS